MSPATMSWPQLFTTTRLPRWLNVQKVESPLRKRRFFGISGLSLPELLVSMAVFMGMSLVMMGLLFQNQRASEKIVAQSDSSTLSLVLFEKVRQEIRTGRVVGNPDTSVLEYWIYKQAGGLPEFGSPHRLVFLPSAGVDPDVARLTVESERLVKNFQGRTSILSDVGPDGQVEFQWIPGSQLVRLYGQVGERNPQHVSKASVRKFQFILSLNNVE